MFSSRKYNRFSGKYTKNDQKIFVNKSDLKPTPRLKQLACDRCNGVIVKFRTKLAFFIMCATDIVKHKGDFDFECKTFIHVI